MAIIDRLSQAPPRHKAPQGSFNPKYQVTQRYMAEIEEVRDKGFLWGQIRKAIVDEAAEGKNMGRERGLLGFGKCLPSN